MDSISTLIFQGAAVQSAGEAAFVLEQAEAAEAISSLLFVQAVLEDKEGRDEGVPGLTGSIDHFVEAFQNRESSEIRRLQRLLAGQIGSLDNRTWQGVLLRGSSQIFRKPLPKNATPATGIKKRTRQVDPYRRNRQAGEKHLRAAREQNHLKNFVAALVNFARAIYMFQKAGIDEESLERINRERNKAFQNAVGKFKTREEGLEKGMNVLRAIIRIHKDAGELHLAAKNYEAAADALAQLGVESGAYAELILAANTFAEAGEFVDAGRVYRRLVETQESTHAYSGGIETALREAAYYFEKGGDRKSAAEMYHKLGERLHREKRFVTAADAFQRSAGLLLSVNESEEAARALALASFLLEETDRFEESGPLWRRAIDILSTATDDIVSAEARLFYSLGAMFRKQNEYREALKMFTEAVFRFEEGKETLAAPAYEAVGQMELRLHHPAKALIALRKARGLYGRSREAVQRVEAAIREIALAIKRTH